jgi:MFS family permease
VAAGGVGAYFTVVAIASVVTRPTLGKLSDSMGRSKVIIPTMACAVLGLFAISFSGDMVVALASAALFGFGYSGAVSALIALNVDTIHPTNRGSATAFYMMFCDSGVAVGSIALAPVAASWGYLPAIWLATMMLTGALALFSVLRWRLSHTS